MAVPSSPAFLILFLCFIAPLLTASSSEPPDRHETFIVHVSKSAKPAIYTTHRHWYSSIVRSVSSHPSKILYAYHRAVTGFSARLTTAQAADLLRHPAVLSVLPDDPASVDCGTQKLTTPGDLNYPSFSVVFGSDNGVVKYKRVVKNVGSSVDAVYEVRVNAPPSVEVSVSPSKLVFSEESKTASYEITFTSAALVDGGVGSTLSSFGSIEWIDGTHSVRSPIAVAWRYNSVVSSM
ncbi:hypothetical protein RJ639_016899 [Escallonia herrerae]|uniref:Uncharacterized protein n=1 Tax=Escallonia herrerae TaxID=1293975 RepID=A0AA89AK57_9ASTE|nr:hypothetical protein RJ639_016899 [Escallonia herrerae]